jgi:ferritin-like protein
MDFDMNKLVECLENGEDAETLANRFADLLNGAVKEYEEKKNAKILAETNERKRNEFHVIMNLVNEWLGTYYPEIPKFEFTPEKCDKFIKTFDESKNDILELIKAMDDLTALFTNTNSFTPTDKFNNRSKSRRCNVKLLTENDEIDEVIKEFFKANNIK